MKKIISIMMLLSPVLVQAKTLESTLENKIDKRATQICACMSNTPISSHTEKCKSLDYDLKLSETEKLDFKKGVHSKINQCDAEQKENVGMFVQELLNQDHDTFVDKNKHLYQKQGINEEQLVGKYTGAGTWLTVLKNNTYVLMAYAHLEIGHWSVFDKSFLQLSPLKTEHPYTVYGRHNPHIEDTKIYVNHPMEIGISDSTKEKVEITSINRCREYPTTAIVAGKNKQLTFMDSHAKRKQPYYTFINENNYNDFVVQDLTRIHKIKHKVVIIENDGLKEFHKKPLESIDGKRKDELDALQNQIKPTDKYLKEAKYMYINDRMKEFSSDIIESNTYHFDSEKNAYIFNGKCATDCESPYDDKRIIHKYERLDNIIKPQELLTTENDSLFIDTCIYK